MPNSLPSGIATVDCSIGAYLDPAGNIDASGRVVISLSDELIWSATGDAIEKIDLEIKIDASGRGTIALPIIQSGFVDASQQPLTYWTYTAKWVGFKFNRADLKFTLSFTDAGPVDLDKKVRAGIAPPASVPAVPYVNTIQVGTGAPMSGNVVLPALSGGGGTGASTVAALTDATVVGKSLLLSADAAAAKTQLGLDKVSNTSDANKPVSTATAQAIAGLVTNAAFTSALQGLVTQAVLTQALSAKMDASVPVLRFCHNRSGSWLPRPVTAAGVPVAFLSYDGTNPPGGGSVGGGAGAVDGLDLVFINGTPS